MSSSKRSSSCILAGLSHGGRDAESPPRDRRRYVTVPAATVPSNPGLWDVMDIDRSLAAALARNLDASFEALVLAHQDRRPWLATIVLNLCRSRATRRAARAGRARPPLSLDATELGVAEPPADETTGPAATVGRRDARQTWAGLLLSLPPSYRSAVVLRHVDGLSYAEVALALDRPEGTVKAQVHRGLALLRAAYEAAQQREYEEVTA